MIGDTEGRTDSDTYGIHFDTNNYSLFHGTYSAGAASNFLVDLPNTHQVTTTFPNARIIFSQGSGDVSCFIDLTCNSSTSIIRIVDTVTNEQKEIHINKYGVVTGIN
jgi:hypothetical protein